MCCSGSTGWSRWVARDVQALRLPSLSLASGTALPLCISDPSLSHCTCAEPRQRRSETRLWLPEDQAAPLSPSFSAWEQVLGLQPLGQALDPVHGKDPARTAYLCWSLWETESEADLTARTWPLSLCCSAALPFVGSRAPPLLLEAS